MKIGDKIVLVAVAEGNEPCKGCFFWFDCPTIKPCNGEALIFVEEPLVKNPVIDSLEYTQAARNFGGKRR